MFASGCFVVPFVFVFGSSDYEQVKGWRRFSDRARSARHFRPTCRPRSLDAKKGTLASTGKSPEPEAAHDQSGKSDTRSA